MEDGWKEWHGGECPVVGEVEIRLRNGDTLKGAAEQYTWKHDALASGSWIDYEIDAYKLINGAHIERVTMEQKPHSHYHKDVSHLTSIDVYRVLDLFGVTDQAIGHAAKKLLVAGGRGLKDISHDVQDVIDTLERWKEMRKEDEKNG